MMSLYGLLASNDLGNHSAKGRRCQVTIDIYGWFFSLHPPAMYDDDDDDDDDDDGGGGGGGGDGDAYHY